MQQTAVRPTDDQQPEAIAEGAEAVRIELSDFEGPLDLLLYLVKKHELDIFNIPIAFISDQYLGYVRRIQQLNLDLAGEYLLMAATLAYIKSRELLPPDPSLAEGDADGADGEEELDPRQELIRRLLEYQKYKEAAGQLGDRPVVGRNVWTRGSDASVAAGVDGNEAHTRAPLEPVPVFQLIEAFDKIISRTRAKLTHDVVVDRISIGDRIHDLVERLEREGTFTFSSCFDLPADQGRYPLVVTFLALLEMTRLRMLRLHQPVEAGEIYLLRPEGVDARALAAEAAAKADEDFAG